MATGCLMRNSLKMAAAATLPKRPVTMMDATVTDTMPPSSSERPMPMAVVMDFGSSVTYWVWSSPNAMLKTSTPPRHANMPAKMPPMMATGYFLRYTSFSYNGMARQTVVGVSMFWKKMAPVPSYVPSAFGLPYR